MNYGTCNLYFSDASRIPQMFFCTLTCLINLKNTQMLRIFFFWARTGTQEMCTQKWFIIQQIQEKRTYALKVSLMLMKRYKAGSQISPAVWHAFTHDSLSSEATTRSAVRGGQDEKELALEAQVRILELGRRLKGLGALPNQVWDEFTGGNGASGEQKSCRWKEKVKYTTKTKLWFKKKKYIMFSNTLNATKIIKELLNTKSCLSKVGSPCHPI